MQLTFSVRTEVIRLIKAKRANFRSFRQAANYRGRRRKATNLAKHLRQFKTEKWLQAELVHYFWSKKVPVIPEYSNEKWDLCIEMPNGKGKFLLALKCLADSGQRALGDFYGGGSAPAEKVKGVAKDLNAIAKYQPGQAALVLILPLDPNDKKRTKYSMEMLAYIDQRRYRNIIDVKKYPIPFASRCSDGVLFVWLESKNKL